MKFEAIVYGHFGQQGIVAWSAGVSEELRRQVDRIIGSGMHSDRSSNEWYAWAPIESGGWVAVAGFRTTDVRAQRAAPAYLAAIVPPAIDEPVIRQPFHLLRKLRELVVTGRYHEARGTIESLRLELPPLQVCAPVAAIRQACEEISASVFVPLLASVLASRAVVVVSRLGQARIGGAIEALIWVLPLARVRQFAFTTELADRGHAGLRLGFVPGDNRFAGMDTHGWVVDLTMRQPEWGRDASVGTPFRNEAESRWRILHDPNVSEGFAEFLGECARPPQPPKQASPVRELPPHDRIEQVFRLAHADPVKALADLVEFAPKEPSKAGPWKSARLNQTLELILQGIHRLDDIGVWMDVLVRFDGRISPAAEQRIEALFCLGDAEARRELLAFVEKRTRNGRNGQLIPLCAEFRYLEPELVKLKGIPISPPTAPAPANVDSGVTLATASGLRQGPPAPRDVVASAPSKPALQPAEPRPGARGSSSVGYLGSAPKVKPGATGGNALPVAQSPRGFWRRLLALIRRLLPGAPSKRAWTNLTIVVAIAGACGLTWLMVNGPHNALKRQAGNSIPARLTNSLGMTFVSLPGLDVLLATREVRASEYAAFASQPTRVGPRTSAGSDQPGGGPIRGVSWEEAAAFCRWLTQEERESRVIRPHQTYRLPTDAEWSAGGLGGRAGRVPNWEWCWDGPNERPERRYIRGGLSLESSASTGAVESRQDAEANRRMDAGFRVVLDGVRDVGKTGGGR